MQRKILFLACLGALALTSCSDNDSLSPEDNAFPKGELIDVVTTLSTNAPSTRAVDKVFEPSDELLAYVQAGRTDGDVFTPVTDEDGFDQSKASIYSKMLTFTMKSSADEITHTAKDDYTNKTSSFDAASNYYWDDFSTSAYDLRTSGRGIRLYYGYCYNGGTPTTGLTDEATGVLGWTVESDQKTKGTKTSDLLFAKTQNMIKYDHNKGEGSQRGTLEIPYTHAMSKFSIEIQCGDGFENVTDPMANTEVTLYNAQLKCKVTAPGKGAGTADDPIKYVEQETGTGATGNVKMHETGSGTQKVFSAIVAPTTLSVGNILATISDVKGIPYTIYITESLLDNAPTGQTNNWKRELDDAKIDENLEEGVAHARPRTRADANIDKGKGYCTRSGVHYHLKVNISKQKIDVLATITDWKDVYAETDGTINFSNDITDKGSITLADMSTFDVYMGQETSNQSFDGKSSTEGINPATTYTYSGGTWSCSPQLYWTDANTGYYFRALSGAVVFSDATSGNITVSNTKVGGRNNNDLIWGTTEAHSGTDADGQPYNYTEGGMLKPRTGDVPLTFRHIMSKVKFVLETETTDHDGSKLLAVDGVNLYGAKIQIDHLATSGNLILNTGEISTTAFGGTLYEPTNVPDLTYNSSTLTAYTANEQIVLPQTISADAKITITLADGTTYKATLKDCKVFADGALTDTPITQWESGKRYIYTIHLKKEEITFRALIKDWEEAKGSGDATLEWD